MKERYIREIQTSAGKCSYKIEIRAYGQTFRKNIYVSEFGSKREALAFAKKLRDEKLVEMQQGFTVSNFPTVKDLYEKTFTYLPARQKTRKRHDIFYRQGIEKHANKTIDKITTGDIQASLNEYARTHTKRQAVGLLAVWKRIYKTAAMMNINIIDRTAAIVMPECKPDTPRKKEISPEDLQRFCDRLLEYNKASVQGNYESRCIYYLVQIMRYTGLRPAEALALTRQDICLASGISAYISVNKAAHSTIDSALEIGSTKTRQSVRNVPISAELLPIVADCLAWSKHELLFADYHGNLQDIDYVSDYVRRVAKQAGVQFNLYMLRHQLSTDLFTSGTPANIIRDIMGHDSANMSLGYAVSTEKDRTEAINSRKFS